MKKGLGALVLALFTMAAYGQWNQQPDPIPAYHQTAPKGPLEPLLSGKQLSGPAFQHPWQRIVYQEAAKVSPVLYQLPCFCRCDLAFGHSSLRSCFADLHGAECITCAKEEHYAYKMSRAGKSLEQIRQGIFNHEYETIDLNGITK